MVIYPVFAQNRSSRTSLSGNAVSLVARFIGKMLVIIMLATVLGVTLGGVFGWLVVMALW